MVKQTNKQRVKSLSKSSSFMHFLNWLIIQILHMWLNIIIYFSLIWHESTLFYHKKSAGYEMCFKTILLIFYIILYIFFYLKFTFISTLIETLKNCLFATNVETNTGMPTSTWIYMSNMKGKLYEAKHRTLIRFSE